MLSHKHYSHLNSPPPRILSLITCWIRESGTHIKTVTFHCSCSAHYIYCTSLVSQPHSVPHHRTLSVSACGGRVWRLGTTFNYMNSWNAVIGWVMHKTCNSLHTSHPPNHSVLATCSESCCTLFVWVLYYRFIDNKSYVGHWDGTDQSLTWITSFPLIVLANTWAIGWVCRWGRAWNTEFLYTSPHPLPYIGYHGDRTPTDWLQWW